MTYLPLHVHSIYSPFVGMMTPEEIVARASFLKFPAVALTDHWTTYGHFEFIRLARDSGIKPILGVEIQHSSLVESDGLFHLTLLAENNEGYTNLVSIVNEHYTKDRDHFVTPGEIASHCKGLIALSGCLKGEAAQAVIHGNLGRMREVIERLSEIFGSGNMYLEIMNHNNEKEQLVNDQLAVFSRKLSIPMVVTNNDRYAKKEDGKNYKILRMLAGDSKDNEDESVKEEYYMKREKELEPYFYTSRSALKVPLEIAERCNVDLNTEGTVEFSSGTGKYDMLSRMCQRRLLLKFHSRPPDELSGLQGRLEEELGSCEDEGITGFLIFLKNMFETSSREGMWLELIGSDLCESFLAYLLEIVPLNPVDHGHAFESFSSPRFGVPAPLDILTSEPVKRHLREMVERLLPSYKVCFQVTRVEMSFTTIVKEIAERHGMTRYLLDEIATLLIPERKFKTLNSILENSDALTHLYRKEESFREILHAAHALHGKIIHFNLNSSRLVILPRNVGRLVSYIAGPGRDRFALLDNYTIESVGGWVLGMQHSHFLSALKHVLEKVRKNGKEPLRFDTEDTRSGRWIPLQLSDPKTYGLISSGETTGVYLLESQGIRELLTRIKPSSFDELVNVISLYRPAPLEGKLWQKYLENTEKKGKVYLPHHSLAAPLEKTRGLLLYKEQVREILKSSAGLKGESVLKVERALRRWNSGDLMNARLEFIRGCMNNGIDEEYGQKIFDFLLHSMKYTHNKTLSCSQAYLSYRTAFFKTHFMREYFASLLDSNVDVRERQKRYLEHLDDVGISILPLDINSSGSCYSVEENGIRAPLYSIKRVEPAVLDDIIAEREEGGVFSSLDDFLERMQGRISMQALWDLVEEGAFDWESKSRDQLSEALRVFFKDVDNVQDFLIEPKVSRSTKTKKTSDRQLSFFDDDED